ncbi:hypothetical protein, partial [Pseudomonas aeruginosa]
GVATPFHEAGYTDAVVHRFEIKTNTGKPGGVHIRITPWALSADVADKRRMTASGYSPYGAGTLSGVSGVCRANNAMGVIRRCRG